MGNEHIYRDLIEIHKCARCGDTGIKRSLHVHHIDGNHTNNEISNLMVLCYKCHRELHNRKWSLRDIEMCGKDLPLNCCKGACEPSINLIDQEYIEYMLKASIMLKTLYGGEHL